MKTFKQVSFLLIVHSEHEYATNLISWCQELPTTAKAVLKEGFLRRPCHSRVLLDVKRLPASRLVGNQRGGIAKSKAS